MRRLVTSDAERFVLETLVARQAADRDRLTLLHGRIDDRALYELAERNRVASTVASRLVWLLGDGAVAEHWRRSHRETAERVGAMLAELDRVASLLAREGIRLVALKNGGIARGLYPHPAECPMGDIDVLVERARFEDAQRILEADGYSPDAGRAGAPGPDADVAAGGVEYLKRLAASLRLRLELQWRPVAGRWIRAEMEPDSAGLISRSVPIEGTDVRLLEPRDNLLQVCLHTAKHSYVRAPGVRLHTDVDRIVRCSSVDWGAFVQDVERREVRTATFLSLAIPRELLRTPIPGSVLQRLCPPRWKLEALLLLLRRAGLFGPDGRKFGKSAYMGFSMLLYDDAAGLGRALFPPPEIMRDRHGARGTRDLPRAYMARLADLALRRVRHV